MDEKSISNRMQKTVDSLKKDLVKIRTGVASAAMLDSITVDYYGAPTPINHVANVTVPEARTISIQPFEKGMMEDIEKAISKSDLGLPTQNDGNVIRLNLPVLTTERRKELAKKVRSVGEDAKIGIRNIRRDENEHLKRAAKAAGESEDDIKYDKEKIQTITDKYIGILEALVSEKEKDMMDI